MDRSYTIVWLGLKHPLRDVEERDRVKRRAHELIDAAGRSGLGWYSDVFDIDEIEGELHWLLVGRNVGMLGFKEGVGQLQLDPSELAREYEGMVAKLESAGVSERPALHILYHFEGD